MHTMLRMSIDSLKSCPVLFVSGYTNLHRMLVNYSNIGVTQTQSNVGSSVASQRFYSSGDANIKIPIVSYEYVKDLPKQPAKMLVDVREPSELAESGAIPSSINIPCKYSINCFWQFVWISSAFISNNQDK